MTASCSAAYVRPMSSICPPTPSSPCPPPPRPRSVSQEAHLQVLPSRAGTWLSGLGVAQPGTTGQERRGWNLDPPSSTPWVTHGRGPGRCGLWKPLPLGLGLTEAPGALAQLTPPPLADLSQRNDDQAELKVTFRSSCRFPAGSLTDHVGPVDRGAQFGPLSPSAHRAGPASPLG